MCNDGFIMVFPLINCVSVIFIIDSCHFQVHFKSLDIGFKLIDFSTIVFDIIIFVFKAKLQLLAFFLQLFILCIDLLQILSESVNYRMYHFMLLVQTITELILSFLRLNLKSLNLLLELSYNSIELLL